jgi:hypothetical protein
MNGHAGQHQSDIQAAEAEARASLANLPTAQTMAANAGKAAPASPLSHPALLRLVELLAAAAAQDVMRAESPANATDDRHRADVPTVIRNEAIHEA